MLALAAFKAMTDAEDPFFTTLKPGVFDARRPTGLPCDAAFPCNPNHPLPIGGRIALAVILSVVGAAIASLGCWWIYNTRKY